MLSLHPSAAHQLEVREKDALDGLILEPLKKQEPLPPWPPEQVVLGDKVWWLRVGAARRGAEAVGTASQSKVAQVSCSLKGEKPQRGAVLLLGDAFRQEM